MRNGMLPNNRTPGAPQKFQIKESVGGGGPGTGGNRFRCHSLEDIPSNTNFLPHSTSANDQGYLPAGMLDPNLLERLN